MGFKDYIVQAAKVGKDAIFEVKEVYTSLFRWLSRYRYDSQELNYKETVGENGKNIYAEVYCEKKISDYIKYVIEVEIYIKDLVNVEVKGKNKQRANIEFVFDAYILKDYEKDWEDKAFLRFIRESYDKFIGRPKLEQYETELKGELEKLMRELKSFLDLHPSVV